MTIKLILIHVNTEVLTTGLLIQTGTKLNQTSQKFVSNTAQVRLFLIPPHIGFFPEVRCSTGWFWFCYFYCLV